MRVLGQSDGFFPSSESQGLLAVDDMESNIPLHLSSVPVHAGCMIPITAPYNIAPFMTPPEIHYPLSTISPLSSICDSRMPSSAMMDLRPSNDLRYRQDTTGFSGAFTQPSPTGMTEKVCGLPAGSGVIAKIWGSFKSLNCHASATNTIFLEYIDAVASYVPLEDWAIMVLALPLQLVGTTFII